MLALTNTESTYLDIPKFQEGCIATIPQYVFENCNQVTCNTYTPETLEKLKKFTKTVTIHTLSLLYSDPKMFEKKGEELDWIYGLRYLEKKKLGKEAFIRSGALFTVADIIKINGKLSRCCNENPGQFRKNVAALRWILHKDFNHTENVILSLLELKIESEKGNDWLIDCVSNSLSKHDEKYFVRISWLRKELKYYQDNPDAIQSMNTGDAVQENIDLQFFEDLVKKYGSKGKFNVTQWLKDNVHYFPKASALEQELQKSLDVISDPKMPVVEKAARIWFDIVRLHISHEANKRTGKAIASTILLAHGYLPPKIDKEDEAEYLSLLQGGLNKKDGHIPFVHFVARKVIQAQNSN